MTEDWKTKKRFKPKNKDHMTGSLPLGPPTKKTQGKVTVITIVVHIPPCNVPES